MTHGPGNCNQLYCCHVAACGAELTCARIRDMDMLKRIQADVQRLRAQRDSIDAELAKLECALEVLSRYESAADGHADEDSEERRDPEKAAERIREVMKAAASLVEASPGMRTSDLYEAVTGGGVTIVGRNPQQYFSTILSRYKDQYSLQFDRREGWSLKPESSKDEPKKDESPGATNTEAFELQTAS